MLSESHKYPRRNGSEHLRLDSRSPALFDTLQIQTPNKTRPIVEKSQSFFFLLLKLLFCLRARMPSKHRSAHHKLHVQLPRIFTASISSSLWLKLSADRKTFHFLSSLVAFFFKNHITQSTTTTTTTDSRHLNNFALYARLRLTNYVLFTS